LSLSINPIFLCHKILLIILIIVLDTSQNALCRFCLMFPVDMCSKVRIDALYKIPASRCVLAYFAKKYFVVEDSK
jgi:hypothetical protein